MYNVMMVDMKNQTVVVSPKFQVVIPREIREAGGILPGSRMSVFEINGVIQLVPVKTAAQYRGLLSGLSSTEVPNDPERF
jgi:AbrB family looped-hinge helix DNA binding protein